MCVCVCVCVCVTVCVCLSVSVVSILASSTDLTRIQTPHSFHYIISEEIKCWSSSRVQVLVLLIIWPSLPNAVPEGILIGFAFDCKINGQALGAALLHSFDRLDGQVQTQRVSELAAVAALQAAASSLRKKCCHSCSADSVL